MSTAGQSFEPTITITKKLYCFEMKLVWYDIAFCWTQVTHLNKWFGLNQKAGLLSLRKYLVFKKLSSFLSNKKLQDSYKVTNFNQSFVSTFFPKCKTVLYWKNSVWNDLAFCHKFCYRWDDKEADCFANICDAEFRYWHEYLGNTARWIDKFRKIE